LFCVNLNVGNTSTARTMFLEEVLALKDRFLPRFAVCFVMSREPQEVEWFNGRIDAAKIREFARHDLDVADIDEFFICGPGTMAATVQSCSGTGACGRVHVEHFAAAPAYVPAPVPGRQRLHAEGATITVAMDVAAAQVHDAMNGEVILTPPAAPV
jgi:ring-1,2-phenylacetyl-CoA epoxidase subunit PaaE